MNKKKIILRKLKNSILIKTFENLHVTYFKHNTSVQLKNYKVIKKISFNFLKDYNLKNSIFAKKINNLNFFFNSINKQNNYIVILKIYNIFVRFKKHYKFLKMNILIFYSSFFPKKVFFSSLSFFKGLNYILTNE